MIKDHLRTFATIDEFVDEFADDHPSVVPPLP